MRALLHVTLYSLSRAQLTMQLAGNWLIIRLTTFCATHLIQAVNEPRSGIKLG